MRDSARPHAYLADSPARRNEVQDDVYSLRFSALDIDALVNTEEIVGIEVYTDATGGRLIPSARRVLREQAQNYANGVFGRCVRAFYVLELHRIEAHCRR